MSRFVLSALALLLGSAAFAEVRADAVQTLTEARAWHADKVSYAGETTDVHLAFRTLADKATLAELHALVRGHSAPGVRYAALRALEERDPDSLATLPKSVLEDEVAVEVCPGGCFCTEESVGGRLAALRADGQPPR